ncbi:MAG: LacI family DNA-binding transcriptional regulator [Anaerolineaceae bacterium]|nr:LacI family DNA-binding transcriptional regulator [Anaerolineaceae bacterium]
MNDKRVTIDDVAKRAGVSRQTVSRAINNLNGISAATRQRVLKIAAEMDYRPSGIARGLANAAQRTRTLGVVLPTVDNEFYSSVLHGVEEMASALGYNVFLCDTNEDPEQERQKISSLMELWIDGVIICSSRLEDEALGQIAAQIRPLVLINRVFQHPNAANVLVDDQQGTIGAVEHLISLGHERIGMIMGLPISRSNMLRLSGYRQAMATAGLAVDEEWLVHSSAQVDGGYTAAKDLLSRHPELSALVVYNDLRAAGVLRACKEMDIRVPEDLSVVSHDNIALSSLLIPSLTTINIPSFELGRQGFALLMRMLEDETLTLDPVQLAPELVIRESSGRFVQKEHD